MSRPVSDVVLRPITGADQDIAGALRLSQAVGWPYRDADWRLSVALGHGLVMEDGGQLVASALWWPYGRAFATCGIVIVLPGWQGRGLGRTLVQRVLDQAGDRSVMLNSTLEGHRLYRELGFVDIGTVHQHQGTAAAASPAQPGSAARPARAEDMAAIARIDERAFGAPRDGLIEEFNRIGTAAVIERDGIVEGFAMCRPFGHGHSIGPVVARSTEDAWSLIEYFLARRAGEFLRVDITGDTGLGDLLAARGLPEVGSVTTMIRGERPPVSGDARVYGLASQSFG